MTDAVVSVLVVTYGHADEIAECLDAALRQEVEGATVEVVVVDNASTDATVDVVRSFPDVLLHALDRNVGYAEGVNTAFAASSGDLVVLLNPDCIMDAGCLDRLRRHLVDHPGVGAAAALLRYPDGTPQLFARRDLTLSSVAWTMTEVGRRLDRKRGASAMARHRYEAEMSGIEEPIAVDVPAAACVATWRNLLSPRPMDPAFPLVFNDAELYRRLRSAGYRCEIVPSATAQHAYGTSLKRVARPRMRAEFVASMRRYVRPWSRAKRAALWGVLAADAVTSAALGNRDHATGTLGGLGLPGGDEPWLTEVPTPARRARALVSAARPDVRLGPRRAARTVRRAWWLARLRLAAALVRAHLETEVDADVDLARRVTFEIHPRSRVRVVIRQGVQLQPDCVLRLGGTLELGPQSQLRYGTIINLKGRLVLEGRNITGRGATVHVDGTMRWGWGTVIGEYASVLDTDHAMDGRPFHPFDHPVRQADVTLEAACFVGAHTTVLAGTTIGRSSLVAAGSTVTTDVPAGVLAAGSPAKVIRSLPSPW